MPAVKSSDDSVVLTVRLPALRLSKVPAALVTLNDSPATRPCRV